MDGNDDGSSSVMNDYDNYYKNSYDSDIGVQEDVADGYGNDDSDNDADSEYESEEEDIYFDPIKGSIFTSRTSAREYVERASLIMSKKMDIGGDDDNNKVKERGLVLEEEKIENGEDEELPPESLAMGAGGTSLVTGGRSDSGTVTVDPEAAKNDEYSAAKTARAMPTLKENANEPQPASQSRELPSNAAPAPAPATTPMKEEEEIDPDVARAEAMALAFQRNPNLTPEEVMLIAAPDVQQKKLVEEKLKNQQQQSQQSHLAAGIRHTWEEFVDGSKHNQHGSKSAAPSLLASLKQSSSSATARGLAQSTSASAASATAATTSEQSPTTVTTVTPQSDSKKPKSLHETIKEANSKAKKKWAETLGIKQPEPTGAADRAVEAAAIAAAMKNTMIKGEKEREEVPPQIQSATATSKVAVVSSSVPLSPGNVASGGKEAATTGVATAAAETTNTTTPTTTTSKMDPSKKVVKTTVTVSRMTSAPPSSSPTSPKSNAATEEIVSKLVTVHPEQFTKLKSKKPQNILSDIVWKRRSGFGKHSLRNAWEQRRIVLRGSKLYYYKSIAVLADAVKKLEDDGENIGNIVDLDQLENDALATGGSDEEVGDNFVSKEELKQIRQEDLVASVSASSSSDEAITSIEPWKDTRLGGPLKLEQVVEKNVRNVTGVTKGGVITAANMTERVVIDAGTGPIRAAKLGQQATRAGVKNLVVKRDVHGANNATGGDNDEKKLGLQGAKIVAGANVKKSIWEQAALRLETAKDSIAKAAESYGLEVPNHTGVAGSASDPSVPRGVIDLVKERATVSAASGHSGAPTPFAISIKVRGETKYKFCFQSRHKQMQWLAALTDVVIRSSVVEYNAALLEEQDCGGVGAAAAAAAAGGAGAATAQVTKGVLRGRFWKIDEYNISSRDILGGAASEEKKDDSEKDVKDRAAPIVDDAEEKKVDLDDEDLEELLDDLELMDEGPSLKGNDLYVSVGLVNGILFITRMVPSSKIWFCILLLCLNAGLWYVVVKSPFGEDSSSINESVRESSGSKRSSKVKSLRQSLRKISSKKKAVHDDDQDESKRTRELVSPDISSDGTSYKPMAGTTALLVKDPSDSKKRKGHDFVRWRPVSGAQLHVRSHGYLTTKQKIYSPSELYECVRVDVFESENRIPNMASRVELPKVKFDDGNIKKNWYSPDIFVVSIAIPIEAPRMTRPTTDGLGYTITLYLKIKEETRRILHRISAPDYDPKTDKSEHGKDVQKRLTNAVRLWEEWCRRSPTDKTFQSRFKFIPQADNPKEIGLPGWIAKYNGKPVLIKRDQVTGFLYNHPKLNAMEFNITLHPFPYLAKQALSYLQEHIFQKAIATFGFVIEGRDDDEFPEVVIGCTQLCYPDPADMIQGNDFFAGKSPKSFEKE